MIGTPSPVNFGPNSQLGGGKSLEGGQMYGDRAKLSKKASSQVAIGSRGNQTEAHHRGKSKCIWIIVAVVFAILLIAVIITVIVVAVSSKKEEANVCKTKQCAEAAENLQSNMDTSFEPCEDFHKFVCGKYDAHNEIPRWKLKHGKLDKMSIRVDEQVKAILEEQIEPGDFEGITLAKKYYHSCIYSEHQKWKPDAEKMMKAYMGESPVHVGQWVPPAGYSKEKQLVKLLELGIGSIFTIEVTQDRKNSAQRIIFMGTPDDAPKAFRNVSLKGKDDQTIAIDSKEIHNMCESILKVPFNKEELNWKTVKELKSDIPNVDWDSILSIFPANMGISDDEIVIVVSWNQFKNTLNILSTAPDRVVQNYIMLNYGNEMWSISPERIKNFGTFAWVLCVEDVKKYFGNIISAEYVDKHMDKKQVKTVEDMSKAIRTTLIENIEQADWIDDKTRSRALNKVDKMELKVGHPKHMFNKTFLMQSYEKVDINENDYFQNNVQLKRTLMQLMLNCLREPVQRGTWAEPPVKVNAYYNRLNNQMVFPAAIMQFPAILDDAPPYLSYGRLGIIIGHEMTHGFDILGHKHNEIGDLEMWWTIDTYKKFEKKKNCFLNQFSNIFDPISGQKLNGKLTLAENMADTGGLKLAYTTFMKLLAKDANMPTLPGMDRYTPEQLFFIVFGNLWCEIYKPPGRDLSLADEHSLGRYRINLSLKNLKEFAVAFKCPENSKMRTNNRCEMW